MIKKFKNSYLLPFLRDITYCFFFKVKTLTKKKFFCFILILFLTKINTINLFIFQSG